MISKNKAKSSTNCVDKEGDSTHKQLENNQETRYVAGGKDGRHCSKCGQWKSWTNFYSKGNRYESRCKSCSKKIKKKGRKVLSKKKELISSFRIVHNGKPNMAQLGDELAKVIKDG